MLSYLFKQKNTFVALLLLLGSTIATPVMASSEAGAMVVHELQQQGVTLKGIVKDANGEPIIGASVVEKEKTTNGTITDLNGYFVLRVSSGASIVVSYMGFRTEELKATPHKNMEIVLTEDTKLLDEVVVVGYGTQRKEELTSSVASVKADNFVQASSVDAASLIRGKIAGLTVVQADGNPLSTSQIMLRGVTTLASSSAPLVIIDGVEGNLNDVSPNDIEQIDVLKDGSAAAIYGTRGTNGVIIISTKKAQGDTPLIIDVNSYRHADGR